MARDGGDRTLPLVRAATEYQFLNRESQVRILPGAPGQIASQPSRPALVEPYVERMGWYGACMPPAGSTRRKRQRGEIEPLPSGSFRVRVYAGIDPISRKRHYLTEV